VTSAGPVRRDDLHGEQSATALLSVQNIDVLYDRAVLALRGTSVTVPEGHVVAVLGSNGAGKSTLMKAVSGLLRAERGEITNGRVSWRGEDITEIDGARRVRLGIALSMEGRHVFKRLTVHENLLTGGHTRKGSTAEDLDLVYQLIPRLKELRGRTAGYLSGGEQQMLAIGRALMSRPSLLMLDEPSLGLAPLLVEEIFGYVRQLNAELKMSVLLVEQNARRALAIADEAYVMESGRVVLHGPADVVGADPQVQAVYLGMDQSGERRSYRTVHAPRRRARSL
jgi:branched-chain amino acid transport system ATP-binding protein